ncbi:hypothetical protein C0U41_09780 [Klebsiella pneumoniae]|nr:hypothetical protein CJ738_02565 [Klebsiella pneumoniae]PAU42064.1 hypothetical protein CKF46_19935 [Klebsiella pneumoniae]PLC21343.1 hypothetical protein C0U41_09780 [Klebsiella pneumoniae]
MHLGAGRLQGLCGAFAAREADNLMADACSAGRIREPINPLAPVRNIRIMDLLNGFQAYPTCDVIL